MAVDISKCRNNFSADKLLKTLQKGKQYPPLTAETEKKMRAEYLAAGREEELRELLAMHHIRYCYKIAGKYSKTTVDFDEMIGNALEGLFIAAQKFDFKKKVRFITYAQPYIFRGVMKEYYDDTQNAVNAGISLDRPILGDDPEGDSISSVIDGLAIDSPLDNASANPGNMAMLDIDTGVARKMLVEAMKYLKDASEFNDFDRYIFVRGVVGGENSKAIAKKAGVPYYKVNRRKAEIIGLVREFLENSFELDSVSEIFS